MTANQFRRIALSLPEVEEHAHQNHPDFRVGGKVFATLGYPDKRWGMVKLTPEQQRIFVPGHPYAFVAAPGAWGLRGSTLVRLKCADADIVHEAMRAAGLARVPKTIKERFRKAGVQSPF